MNLSAVHGSATGILTDSVVQEIDVKTGPRDVGVARARAHPARANRTTPRCAAAIRGTTCTSTRPTRAPPATCCCPRATPGRCTTSTSTAARFSWRLGGAHSSFKLGAGTRFYWQHDAEFQPGGLISMFDNGSTRRRRSSRGACCCGPNTANHTVSLVKQFVNPSKTLLAESQGNTLSLPGGNWLLGYGRLPNFTEFDASGHVLLDGTLGRNVQNFSTLPLAVERAADDRAVAGRAVGRRRRRSWRSPSAGTGPPRSPPGACWPVPRRRRSAPRRDGRQGGLSDDDHGAHGRALRRRAGARRLGRGASAPRRRSRSEQAHRSARARAARRPRRAGCGSRGSWALVVALAAGAGATARARASDEPRSAPRCTPPRLNVSAALAGSRVTVSPGTRNARRLRGRRRSACSACRPSELSGVSVVGSRSGAHTGPPARLLAGRRSELRAGPAVRATASA